MSIIEEIDQVTATKFSEEHLAKRYRSVSELDKDRQHGDQVVSVDMDTMPPALWGKAGDFLAACEKAGMLLGKEYGGHKAWLPLTPEQKAERLDVANHNWDRDADRYDAALVDREKPSDWTPRYAIQNYCERRGIKLPWDEED